MPPIYDRPAKSLIADWAKANLTPDQTFSKSDVVRWFAEHYPKIKRGTIETHVEFMSVNCRSRLRYSAVKPGGGCDLFLKVGPNQYRLWNPDTNGPPLHKPNIEPARTPGEIDIGVRLRARPTKLSCEKSPQCRARSSPILSAGGRYT